MPPVSGAQPEAEQYAAAEREQIAALREQLAELTRQNEKLQRELDQHLRAEADIAQQNRELLSLQSAVAATASSLDLEFVLESVTWEMTNLLNVGNCLVLEWDQQAGSLITIAQHSPAPLPEAAASPDRCDLADCPLQQRVLTERYSAQFSTGHPDLSPAARAFLEQSGARTILLLPMVFHDRVVGLVKLADYTTERTFTDREISLAQVLATHAASAIENARLYERAQHEIAERARAEELIRASLQEKEVLLQEIHHRVKNNLQIISSMLSLQANYVNDPATREIFRESQHRVRSMALIHEKLYRAQDLARIDLGDYIRNLAAYLIQSYQSGLGPVRLAVESEDVFIGIEKAVPCGLILNELVTNSLKHAFPEAAGDQQQGAGCDREISIQLRRDDPGRLVLMVADNGVGFPAHLDFRNTDSLGMQIVSVLVQQLDATIDLKVGDGTCFTIAFDLPATAHAATAHAATGHAATAHAAAAHGADTPG